jgi:LysR family transcriptional activator of nhaA
MVQLNFHHLLLFTTLVREGSLLAAGRVLRLSHATVGAQIRALEESLGTQLVARQGRRLVPTEMGMVVNRYAEEIFGLGRELVDTVQGRAHPGSRLRVGIVDVVPKLIVRKMLEPIFAFDPPVQLVCFEDTQERVLSLLGLHEIDVVISDAPAAAGGAVRAYNHLLGTCEVAFYGASRFARLSEGFPRSLDGAPMLLPLEGSPLRRMLNVWFGANDIRPHIVGEFEDSALMKVIAQDGLGVFPSPGAIDREIERQFRVKVLGRAPQLREQFYAISSERRIKDPLVQAISDVSREDIFRRSRGARRRSLR